MVHYVFDVDGTLTQSRAVIDPDFKKFFVKWMNGKTVHLISGSDKSKILEQVGEDIFNNVTTCYLNQANVVFKQGKMIFSEPWEPSKELLDLCQSFIDTSPYPVRAGTHIEKRIGMINISVVGRDCTYPQRLDYNRWDQENHEREKICKAINERFPDLEASTGGQISVDIQPKGKDKGQLRSKLDGVIWFFGDKTMPGGNDYALAKLLKDPDKVIQVKDWQQTYSILKRVR